MKGNVSAEQAVTSNERPLSPRVQEALGELVGVAQEGLLALSVGIGLGILTELGADPRTPFRGWRAFSPDPQHQVSVKRGAFH